jgi:hypothetical protein
MPANRPTVMPGEAPPPEGVSAPEAGADPAPPGAEPPAAAASAESPADLARRVQELEALVMALAKNQARPDTPASAIVLPTQDEAAAKARETGKFILSRDGYVGPKVIRPAPPA